MRDTIRSVLIWLLAALGGLLFVWYVVASGQGTLADPTAPPTIMPPELVAFGVAAGTLLATNLGAVLGISINPPGGGGGRGLSALTDSQRQPWAQLFAAALYIGVLLYALYIYWQSGWSANGAEIIRSSVATLSGVVLGAMSSVMNSKS